jgi:hypothetical protein
MSMISTKDGTQIFFKDWGPKDAQVINADLLSFIRG